MFFDRCLNRKERQRVLSTNSDKFVPEKNEEGTLITIQRTEEDTSNFRQRMKLLYIEVVVEVGLGVKNKNNDHR